MPLPDLTEAKGPQDDWTGLRDAKERRKLQNRLNVRAHRRRKALATTGTPVGDSHKASLEQTQAVLRPNTTTQPEPQTKSLTHSEEVWLRKETWIGRHPSSHLRYHQQCVNNHWQNHTFFHHIMSMGGPQAFPMSRDHLIPLIQYNNKRAILALLDLFGYEPHMEIEPSDFPTESTTPLPLFPVPRPNGFRIPNNLLPTKLQREVAHPRWIDLMPHPRLRDNTIRALGTLDFDDLACDLMAGICGVVRADGTDDDVLDENDVGPGAGLKCLLVWSDPWRPEGLEMTWGFVKKWGFLVEGCDEFFVATNRWRAIRGEEPLSLKP